MKPLISVIIPVFNADRYLTRCLDSVLSQKYKNIEIILVNDGSTDDSLKICNTFASRFPYIKILDQNNTGASLARKRGISEAKGEYLVFVDSDDFVSPYYVSALYDALSGSNSDIALCPMKRIDIGDNPDFSESIKTRKMLKDELFKRFFKYEFWGFWGGIYRRRLFDRLVFPEATVNEDYYVKAQMFAGEEAVGYVEEALYCYEQHPGSLSKQPLSLRALGEFDNALATWEFIRLKLPDYSNQALAIASEAACKWLGALNNQTDSRPEFQRYQYSIKRFLKTNFLAISINPHLYWKIKVVLCYHLLH